jgi:hypothetical protein
MSFYNERPKSAREKSNFNYCSFVEYSIMLPVYFNKEANSIQLSAIRQCNLYYDGIGDTIHKCKFIAKPLYKQTKRISIYIIEKFLPSCFLIIFLTGFLLTWFPHKSFFIYYYSKYHLHDFSLTFII